MDVFEVIEARRSVRRFRPAPVPAEDLERILDACDRAPSAGNLQAYEIHQVESEELREALFHAAYDQAWIREAPVVLVFSAHPERSKRYGDRGATLYAIQDATVAAAYAQLAAVARGLASCWIGAFDEDDVSKALELPRGLRPIVLLPIGLADEVPDPPKRRGTKSLVHRI